MNNNKSRILKEIFSKPTYKFHIRELAKITNLNPNTIINITESLVKEDILIQEKKKHITEISFNFDNPKAVIRKRLSNIEQLYSSGLIEHLTSKLNPELISAIGSYSKGEDIEKSDIDIVIIADKEEYPDLSRYEKSINRKIHLIITHYKKMSDEFYTNLINGLILYGYINKK
ncbi:MAG TPA: nucleotidyltransferase domain-containing protein [Candidatus Nanoarchaeia archaeon]|nr:nucleotidyltransferase domain-containing protein [Candidatus Nanoarchaeia archaeon]